MIHHEFPVKDYALADTLGSGQAFRWREMNSAWEGVVNQRWVRLTQSTSGIRASVVEAPVNWNWLTEYLQVNVDLNSIIASFPKDPHMLKAVKACRGLRLLRQYRDELFLFLFFRSRLTLGVFIGLILLVTRWQVVVILQVRKKKLAAQLPRFSI